MTLTFTEGDTISLYLYYEELGCYFHVMHTQQADYEIKFPAYDKVHRGFKEYLLHTDISTFEKGEKAIIKDIIEQITDISQRNLLPQHSKVQEDLLDLVFENGSILKVKE
jgi:hypothetical protein